MFRYAVYLNELVDKMQLLSIEYENCKKLIINEESKLLELNLKSIIWNRFICKYFWIQT